MRRGRLVPVWLLSAAFMAAAVWWILYVPHRPERLYRAIPSDVKFLSAHKNLAGRWDELTRNPLVASALSAWGVSGQDLEAARTNADFRIWLERLTSDETLVAYAPKLASTGEPALILASWIGPRSQRLRWALNSGRVPGFTKVYDHAGHRVWLADRSVLGIKTPHILTVSIAEGMIFATLSSRVASMADVLNAYDGERTSVASGGLEIPASRNPSPDAGWYRTRTNLRVDFSFASVSAKGFVARVDLPWSSGPEGANAPASLDELTAIWGDAPVARLVFDRRTVVWWLARLNSQPWLTIRRYLSDFDSKRVVLAVLRDDYDTRWMGIKVPTLMVATDVSSETSGAARVEYMLDDLNSRHRWGLITRPLRCENRTVQAVMSTTADTTYSRWPLSDQAAYFFAGRWMVLASNVGSLTNLLQRPEPAQVRMSDSLFSGRVDLNRGAKMLKLALSAWSLKLAFQDPEGTQEQRRRLNEVKAWMDTLTPFHEIRYRAEPDRERLRIEVEAGNPAGGEG